MVDAEDRRSQDRTDQAALMGAALAAVIATVIQPGLYSLYGSFTGAVLACLVLTYYHRVPMSQGSGVLVRLSGW
jgi:hypothetical protein